MNIKGFTILRISPVNRSFSFCRNFCNFCPCQWLSLPPMTEVSENFANFVSKSALAADKDR